MTGIERAVRRGADYLDNHGPIDWAERVKLDKLDIISSDNCILGQVYGSYYLAKEVLDINADEAGQYGFNAKYHDSHELDRAWITLITELRKPLPAPEPEQREVVLTPELVELFAERLEQINDPSDTLEESVFVVDGVRIVLK